MLPLIVLALGMLLSLAGWGMSLRFRTVPAAPSPLPGSDPGAEQARISVIVPARDEEANLSRLLPSLAGQETPPFEMIVVDDQSADATARVAREHGAKVVAGAPLPEGWFGKPWACQQGAEASSGDWLLFLDADTVLEPGAMPRLAALTADRDSVHAICPYHRVARPHEELSAFFNTIMVLGMNAFTLKGERAASIGLFGQAMLVSREQYEAVGGHATVKREVLENFHLSRDFAAAGYRCRCYLGRGTIWMRMFPAGPRDLVDGWSKGFVSGADNTPRSALVGISLWLTGLIMVTMTAFALPFVHGAAPLFIAAYAACALQCLYLFRSVGSFSPLSALLFPAGLIFYQAVFFRALRRKRRGGQIRWKGRDVA